MQKNGVSPRSAALDKVCGRERYAVDETPPGCLWAGVRRAGIPHGLIAALDVAPAREVPGVVAVLTRKDVPGTNRQGIMHKDQPVLCGTRVRHCGDPVALVVAETREALAEGLARIRVDFMPLPGVFDPEEALLPDAPLVHPGREVTTAEGLGSPEAPHPLQTAFAANGAVQCGYCSPGMTIAAVDLLARTPDPDRGAVRQALSGNLCRCTGYGKIVDAVLAAAKALREEDS